MSIEAPTDGDVFRAYLEHVLCPQWKPGQLVVMDNPGAPKVDGIRELIEQTGAALCYLPPYSPDSTRSKNAGHKSNRNCARSRPVLSPLFSTLSPKRSRQFLPKMPQTTSAIAAIPYDYSENALAADIV